MWHATVTSPERGEVGAKRRVRGRRRAARPRATRLAGAALLLLGAVPARADDTVKIGVLLPFSGPFADVGMQIGNGMALYLKQHGDVVAGKKIVLIRRDSEGAKPDVAKRLAQELITRDKVDFLAGFGLTPEALAVASIATEAKKPMVVMNAATSVITEKSPYIVRFSFTLSQIVSPLGEWAAKNGIKRAYVAVADYAPGYEAEAAFTKAFTAAGGEVVGTTRVPINNLEFAAYVQRIKDAAPQGIFLFVPSGEQPIAFMKSYVDLGLKQAGIVLLGGTEIIDETVIATLGDKALGAISVQNYSTAHPSTENKKYLADWQAAFGAHPRPNFMSVAGYDGMHAISDVVAKLDGVIDPDKAMAAFKEIDFISPRGAIAIDPATRDLVESVYIRRVERVDGELVNQEIFEFPRVKSTGSAQ
jgi:branched-chain amino acid transport system substrate-binding protein